MARTKTPKVNIDVLVVKDNKVLLGLLTSKWNYQGKRVYGVPGRDIKFGVSIGSTVKRDIKADGNSVQIYCSCIAGYGESPHKDN